MIKFLWRLIVGGCNHKWKIIDTADVTAYGLDKGRLYVLQCEHCGEIKTQRAGV